MSSGISSLAKDRGIVTALAHPPNGKLLFTGQSHNALSQWVTQLGITEEGQSHCKAVIQAIALASDGKDGTVARQKQITHFAAHTKVVTSIAWTRSGRHFASGDANGAVQD